MVKNMFAIVGINYPVHLSRNATSLFGIVSQGAHLTAYTRPSSGSKIWFILTKRWEILMPCYGASIPV